MLHAIVLAAALASPSPAPSPAVTVVRKAARTARLLSDLVAVEQFMRLFKL
jgi:hypothetical protein